MKKTNKIVALLLALVLLFCATAGMLVSCGDPEEDGDPCTSHVDDDKNGKCDKCGESVSNGNPEEKTTYTVSLKSMGGMPIEGVVVVVYEDNTLEEIEGFATTNADGVATFSLKPSNSYAIEINSGLPEGYKTEAYYSFSGASAAIKLDSAVIANPNNSFGGESFKLGDIMKDFTATMSDGTTVQLSELLKTKKAVLINFWYTTCSWCIEEFPFMESAYQQYKDDIAIVALDPYESDSNTDINLFKGQHTLSFPMGQDKMGISTAFGVNAYPTSVIVDRYGAITLIVPGAITGEKYFNKLFEHYTAEPYNQKLLENYTDLSPVEKPNISQPSSDEISAVISPDLGFNYYPEEGTADAEYSWPFIIGTKDGVPCIMSSNAEKDSSYSTMHVDVTLAKGEALALEYFSSTEGGSDFLYILVDGVSVSNISGVNKNGWEICYPYVAEEAGTYKVTFIYLKDSSTDTEDDTIYIKRLFKETDLNNINVETYIPRWAATVPNTNGLGYQNYVKVVLGADGYYHVGDANGPLLLANLMGITPFSASDSVYSIIYTSASIQDDLAQYYDAVIKYCNYASNASISGLCTVDEGLRFYLEKIADKAGYEKNNPKQWLQMCLYYSAYGTDGKQLVDPIAGLAPHSAPEAVVGTVNGDEFPNKVTYNRPIMPRGLWNKFTPTQSGAYLISTNVDKKNTDMNKSLNGWIFNEDGSVFYEYSISKRLIDDSNNVYMYAYLEAGRDYYIDIAYYDIYTYDTFGFRIEYLGESYEIFRAVSPGAPFTYEVGKGMQLYDMSGNLLQGDGEFYASITMNGGVPVNAFYDDIVYYLTRDDANSTAGNEIYIGKDKAGNAYLTVAINSADKTVTFTYTNPAMSRPNLASRTVRYEVVDGDVTDTIIPGGTKIVYDAVEDRYYNVLPNGTKGSSKIYVDFSMLTSIFSNKNLTQMIELNAFNFAMTENDYNGMLILKQYPTDEDLKAYWGEDFEENFDIYKINDLRNGIYHGKGTDYTAKMREYLGKMITATTNPMDPDSGVSEYPLEMRGCTEVNAELAGILQLLMDKYTFSGVENSWVKLCYYYETIDESWEYISPLA